MEREVINNAFYEELDKKWYEAYDHPIAILRAENKTRAPWVIDKIGHFFQKKRCTIIDIGCGGGFLSNTLAKAGHRITGIDLSEGSLAIAREMDSTKTVLYRRGDALALPFSDKEFDVACAMDLLEHVEHPGRVIFEASRVLKKGGLLFFHTFNRSWLSWLFALKGLEWFVPNSPPNIHLYRLFIKPEELELQLEKNSFKTAEIFGLMPAFNRAFFKLLISRKITPDFSFKMINSTKCGYMGYAIKL